MEYSVRKRLVLFSGTSHPALAEVLIGTKTYLIGRGELALA